MARGVSFASDVPAWLEKTAIAYLVLSLVSTLIVIADLLTGRRQHTMVMNFVWPITTLWAGPLGFLVYWFLGRADRYSAKDFWQSVLIDDTHWSAGYVLGDIAGEWIVFSFGLMLAGSPLLADYGIAFVLAFTFGVVFQYYSVPPFRRISGWPGLKASIRADAVSLLAFEAGAFAWIALMRNRLFHPPLEPVQPIYWFMMQIAMLIGFLTFYPANWWLIRKGWKESM